MICETCGQALSRSEIRVCSRCEYASAPSSGGYRPRRPSATLAADDRSARESAVRAAEGDRIPKPAPDLPRASERTSKPVVFPFPDGSDSAIVPTSESEPMKEGRSRMLSSPVTSRTLTLTDRGWYAAGLPLVVELFRAPCHGCGCIVSVTRVGSFSGSTRHSETVCADYRSRRVVP